MPRYDLIGYPIWGTWYSPDTPTDHPEHVLPCVCMQSGCSECRGYGVDVDYPRHPDYYYPPTRGPKRRAARLQVYEPPNKET